MNFDVIKRDEVRLMYEQAADKRMQIRIMSELMSCEEADICDLLGIPATRKRKRHQINEEEALKMHQRGASDREIAEEFGVTKDAVKAWKWRTGLMEQSEETKAKYAQCMGFYEQGMTDGEIALATGMKRKAVCDWRKQNKLPPQKRPHREWGKDDERFMPLYESGMNDVQIADVFGLNYWNVRSWRHRRGLKANKSGKEKIEEISRQEARPKGRPGKDWIKDDRRFRPLYEKGLNDQEIEAATGEGRWKVCDWRHKFNLPPNRRAKK